MLLLICIGVLLAAVCLWLVSIYNQLVTLQAQYRNSFAQIDVQLRRRHDLIPNLVATVKGYLHHESSTLATVIEARNTAMAVLKAASSHPGHSNSMQQLAQAENQLTRALGSLNVQLEAYPDLKGNETIRPLFEELTTTENRVAFSRQAFNDGVTSYNIYRRLFPNILVATRVGHNDDAALLEMDDSALQNAPTIQLN